MRVSVESEEQAALGSATEAERWPRAVLALRNPNFRRFWCGNLASNIGTWMQNVAQGWLVLLLTNSAFWLGVVSFAGSIPFLLFTLFGGVVADRMDKRRLLFVTQSAMMVLAFLLAALAFFKGHDGKPLITIGEVAAIAFLNGVALSMNSPSYQAMVPRLVEREDLTNAIALNSAQFHMSRIVGPSLGGYAMAAFGVAGNFFLNGLSFFAMLFALTRIRIPQQPAPPRQSVWASLHAGFRYVRHEPQMFVVVLLTAVMSLLVMPFIAFIPFFARNQLGTDARGLGWMLASSGAGAVTAAITVAWIGNVRHRGIVITLSSMAVMLVVIGVCFTHSFALALCLMPLEGYGMILTISSVNVAMQHLASDEMRGRVMGIFGTCAMGLPPLGALAAGELSRHVPTNYALAAMVSLAFVFYAGMLVFSRPLRELD